MSSSTNNKLSNVAVVVRSAHERTEALCIDLLLNQVDEKNLVVIHERPFSQALRRGFEIGIDIGLEWTLCVDADLLVAADKLGWLVESIANQSSSVLGGHARVLDKMYGRTKYAGLHLYRTALLKEAILHIPDIAVSLRPETYAKQVMASNGHAWVQLNEIVAIHDFEQFYSDIYRTMVVRAKKSSESVTKLLKFAERMATHDDDFLVCAWALRVALSRDDAIQLDSEQWREEAALLLAAHNLKEKSALIVQDNVGLPNTIIKQFIFSKALDKVKKGPHTLYVRLRNLLTPFNLFCYR